MIRRLFNALRRETAEQPSSVPPRPNALSREVARAERLRREALRAEVTTHQRAIPPQGERTRRDRQPLPSARGMHATPLTASLRSRSELRRALLLNEILGPPAALRGPRIGASDQQR
jgi:hypothetical protein